MMEVRWFLSEMDKCCNRANDVMVQLDFLTADCDDGEEPADGAESGILFEDLTGLKSDRFPQYNSLDEAQLSLLVAGLLRLYHRYGLNPVFQPHASNRVKYLQMRDFCSQLVYPNQGSMVDVEFCDYHEGRCPYAEDCHLAHLIVNNCFIYRFEPLHKMS